jgi:hypothetical protein
MKYNKILAAASVSLFVAVSASAASASTAVVNAYDAGYYQNSGGTPTYNGLTEDSTRNNYFVFDLSGVSGTVIGATLTIFNTGVNSVGTPTGNGNYMFQSGAPAPVTYSIYDVTATSIAALVAHTAGAAAFTDLGNGAVYGSTSITNPSPGAFAFGAMPQLTINLANGLSDINGALGGLLAMGGSSDLPANQGFLWISPADFPTIQLSLEVQQTPVPAALPLFATGLGALGLIAHRRKRKQTA